MSYQQDFINQISQYVISWSKVFGWGVPSAIIAQACLESAYGTSNKAIRHNYFGLKFRMNRVQCNSGVFTDTSYEQKPSGEYIPIVTQWYSFPDMNFGVQGYFQFIDSGNYGKAKTQTTPESYLTALKECGYATSQNYVTNLLKVIYQYNLTQYDEVKPMFTNSPLVTYIDLSPGNYGERTSPISKVTIHHMAGNLSVETCGRVFHNKSGNSNYGIGTDGRIAMYVEEKNGAWTSSNKANDMVAVTIEVANEILAPYWTVSALAMNSLINLLVDICQRNGIPKLIWSDSKYERINGINGANMTLHSDFASTACPGPFLKACMPNIADLVNQRLAVPIQDGFILNGYDYSPVFDPTYYANKYPDVVGAFGNDSAMLWKHFCDFGMNEFRQASENFNPDKYRANYEDLRNAFGEDKPMYYWHYIAFGINEGRTA